MTRAALTSPPMVTPRLVVDTDVASFIFKWHPEFAPRYISIVRGSELVVSFMTLAEMGMIRRSEPDEYQTVRIAIGQGANEHRADDAEHQGVGADSQGEGEHGQGREPGVP